MNQLKKMVADGSFLLDLKAPDMESVLHQAVNHVVAQGKLAAEHRDEVEQSLLARERKRSSAIGNAVAIPHAYMDAIPEQVIVFIRLAKPLHLGAPDKNPTRFVFLLLGAPGQADEHLDTLANVARVMSDDAFRYDVREADNGRDLAAALRSFEERRDVEAPEESHEVPESLKYTGRLGGGAMADIRRRLPHYVADFRDGLHTKSISSTLFLLFACLAPAIIFGGLMSKLTDGQIGAVEMIVASAFCGVIYALFSGTPLIILGGTGPLLIFTVLLYGICKDWGLPFLPTLCWIGLWSGAALVILSVTDASFLMRYFTRFTDEIFAAFISITFIVKAVEQLVHIFTDHEVGYDTALLSLLLAAGTFYIGTSLRNFRRSRFLVPQMREFLADFGPAIALAAMTAVAVSLHKVDLSELPAPDSFQPTLEVGGTPRAWLVNPLEAPVWVWFATIIPALLVTVLVYVDQNITARLVNSPDHRLEKGEAYHYDLGLIGILIAICSMFGLPWLVAATVRSLNHVRSLATVEEVATASGGMRERILHIRENRITPLAIHVFVGLSLLLLPYLRQIPMAVLYGLFLYMGVVSLSGNQFFERICLWLTQPSMYPITHYIRRVPIWTIHGFTVIQVLCLGALMAVEQSPLAILFPLFIAILVPIRLLIGRWFSTEHLDALDAHQEPKEEEDEWA